VIARLAAETSALAGFGHQHHGAVEADVQDIVVERQGFILRSHLEVGAEAPDACLNHRAGFGMRADVVRLDALEAVRK
jgi:hypothetical protein